MALEFSADKLLVFDTKEVKPALGVVRWITIV